MSQNSAKKLNPILDKDIIINRLKRMENTGKGFESLRLHKLVNKTYQNPINSTIYRVLSFKSPSDYSIFPNCSETLARP